MRGRTALLRSVAIVLLLLTVASPVLDAIPAAGATPVATTTLTLVDSSRSTPAWDGMPAKSSRTLVTTVWYPARESAGGSGNGPYPLIVFAHGLGGSPQEYAQLLRSWAGAGYVVAAPPVSVVE